MNSVQTLFFVGFAFLFVLVPHYYTNAATSYSVAPLIIEKELEPRDILQEAITISNTGSSPVTAYPTINNVRIGEDGGLEEFLPPVMSDRKTSISSWIEFNRRGIELAPGETKELSVTLRVNPNAEPGRYNAFLSFGHGRNRDIAEAMVRRGGQPGTIINVTIKDDTKSFLRLSKFLIDRIISSNKAETVSYSLQNPGDVPMAPTGDIIFYNSRGKEVASMAVNPENITLQPGENITLKDTVPVDGLLGKYKAFLTIEYGNQLASINDTAFFYVLPWQRLLIYFGLLLTAILLVVFFVHKKYGSNEDDDYDEYEEEGVSELPLYLRDATSKEHHRDINLKKKK